MITTKQFWFITRIIVLVLVGCWLQHDEKNKLLGKVTAFHAATTTKTTTFSSHYQNQKQQQQQQQNLAFLTTTKTTNNNRHTKDSCNSISRRNIIRHSFRSNTNTFLY